MFRAKRLPPSEVEKQKDGKNCGMFYLGLINCIIFGLPILGKVTQANIEQLRNDTAMELYLNSNDLAEV